MPTSTPFRIRLDVLMAVPINKARVEYTARQDAATVAKYVALLSKGLNPPPIWLANDGVTISDGGHRVGAALALGRIDIEAVRTNGEGPRDIWSCSRQ